MNRFYIDKLTVSGGGHKTTVIDFKPGLNFILGPSNTGKSLMMDCLDYAFGFTPKKNRPSKIVDNNYGYERIAIHLITGNGTVILERKIGDTKIAVSGTDPTVDHGTYSVGHKAKKNINAVYLHLQRDRLRLVLLEDITGQQQMPYVPHSLVPVMQSFPLQHLLAG